ncbi:MAG: hypothetical protein WA691_00700 [Thermoplasmata archaeon]
MSRAVVAVALALVMVLSVLAGFVAAAHGSPAPGSPAATGSISGASTPAISSITVFTYNGAQTQTPDFCTGSCIVPYGPPPYYNHYPGANTILFTVIDTAADHTVNLTLNDPNATRDGLTNPVFTASLAINQTTHESPYSVNHLSYTFPAALVFGGGWNVTTSAPLGGFTEENLTVDTFALTAVTSPAEGSAVLPGETVSLSWWVVSTANGAPYTQFTSLTLWGSYFNATVRPAFSPALFPLTGGAVGSTTFVIPANATANSGFDFAVSAVTNLSGKIAENSTVNSGFNVGYTTFHSSDTESTAGCPGYSASTFYEGGSVFVYAVAGAEYSGAFTPVPGLTVGISFWNGESAVTAGGSPPSALTTSNTGAVCFSFVANAPPFTLANNYPFGNAVNLTVTDSAATGTGDWKDWSNLTFDLISGSATGAVQVSLDANEYAPGATVTASWSLGGSNGTATGGLHVNGWSLLVAYHGTTLETGLLTGTATSGTFTVVLPADFLGEFYVIVSAANSTTTFFGVAVGVAETPTLLVSGPTYYTPGSSISWGLQFSPTELAGTAGYYSVTGYWEDNLGEVISEGIVAQGTVGGSNSVGISVPSASPATAYVLDVWAQTAANGVYASNSATASLETGYYVLVGVSTQSNYADGSYQPGQTVQVTWQIVSYSGSPLPSALEVSITLGSYLVADTFGSTSTSGSVGITLPSNLPTGGLEIDVQVAGNMLAVGPDCEQEAETTTGYCYGTTGIDINAHPSVLSMELGAGSGLTVGWLILLIIILVAVVLLLLVIRRGRAPKNPAWSESPSGMNPPSPAPSTPPAAEWKAPEAPPPSGDSPPPLPTPPPGAS